MFDKFTAEAIRSVMLAQEESRRLGHDFTGTEFILLGLIGETRGLAAKALKSVGVNLSTTRFEVEKIIGRGPGHVCVELPFTPRVKRALELSWAQSRQLGHNYVGPEHLLLGLLDENDETSSDKTQGVASTVLRNMEVDLTALRTKLLDLIKTAK